MSKLYNLLETIIGKLNRAVSTDAQNLSDEEKAQAKANLGISESSNGGDWNQNNSTASDYVQNRTHWKEEQVIELLPVTAFTEDIPSVVTNTPCDAIKDGDSIKFVVNGTEYEVSVTIDDKAGRLYVRTWVEELHSTIEIGNGMTGEENFSVSILGADFSTHPSINVQVLHVVRTYHPLSDEYIPSNIVRQDQVQGDWYIHDQSNPHYIMNRPFYHKEEENTVIYRGTLSPTTDEQSIPVTQLEYFGHYSVQIGKEWLYSALQPQDVNFLMGGQYIGNLSLGYSDCENTGEAFLIIEEKGYDNLRVWLSNDVISEYSSEVYPPYITLSLCTPEELKKLDEKFIPDNIARKSDIPEVPVTSVNGQTGAVHIETPQSDWNMNSKYNGSYIKNRTHYTYNTGAYIISATEVNLSWYNNGAHGTITCDGNDYKNTFKVGDQLLVSIDDDEYVCRVETADMEDDAPLIIEVLPFNNNRYWGVTIQLPSVDSDVFIISASGGDDTSSFSIEGNITLYHYEPKVVQLEDKYIPNSIARRSDLPITEDELDVLMTTLNMQEA